LTAEERLERFRATVSPTASQLAAYLAAAPLTLSVMRLVQYTMLPDSHPSHLAEVVLGGLLKRVTSADATLPAESYDFHEGVRELLLSSVLKTEAFQILRSVGHSLERQIGRPFDFPSLLPDSNGQFQIPETAIPFARVSAFVMSRLGRESVRPLSSQDVPLSYIGIDQTRGASDVARKYRSAFNIRPRKDLPPRPQPFFGREAELQDLVDTLLQDSPEPTPILGDPGIGKSTFALVALHDERVAQKYRVDGEDRRFFIHCQSSTDSREKLGALIANELGVVPRRDQSSMHVSALDAHR
jgi:hypothetical protein